MTDRAIRLLDGTGMGHAEPVSAAGALEAWASRRAAARSDRAWSVVAALVGLSGEGVAVAVAHGTAARINELTVAAVVLAYGAVGVLVLWHRPGHRVGRLAAAIAAVWGLGEGLVAVSYAGLPDGPHPTLAALGSAVGSFLRGLPWLVAVM